VVNHHGKKILFRQIAGYIARRIVCYAKEGMQVEQGQETGFIKFGSRVDLFLPLEAKLKVKLGDKVKGTQTVIATIE
jgi:phosphatidylserine decarboxylase